MKTIAVDWQQQQLEEWNKLALDALVLCASDHSKGCGCKACQSLESHPDFQSIKKSKYDS